MELEQARCHLSSLVLQLVEVVDGSSASKAERYRAKLFLNSMAFEWARDGIWPPWDQTDPAAVKTFSGIMMDLICAASPGTGAQQLACKLLRSDTLWSLYLHDRPAVFKLLRVAVAECTLGNDLKTACQGIPSDLGSQAAVCFSKNACQFSLQETLAATQQGSLLKLVAACCQPDKLEELVTALAKHTQEATRAHGIAAFVQMLSPGLHAWLQSGHGFDRLRSCCLDLAEDVQTDAEAVQFVTGILDAIDQAALGSRRQSTANVGGSWSAGADVPRRPSPSHQPSGLSAVQAYSQIRCCSQ